MTHRGPDDEGVNDSAPAVLGQRRLSIIDLAGGHQPIANADETSWVICNGEIYNYRELRSELVAEGVRFRCESDTEVILRLYERDGVDCLRRLRGMFAFAIWDARKQMLFCARDRLGQKPFFYYADDHGIAFSSEIKALLAYDPSLRVLNRSALDQYLSLRIVASPDTMFERVRKLPPGHMLIYQPGRGATISPYWMLEYEPKWQGTENELVDELEARLI
jgi:asparagine synthase (glutamine-hydrolysing)